MQNEIPLSVPCLCGVEVSVLTQHLCGPELVCGICEAVEFPGLRKAVLEEDKAAQSSVACLGTSHCAGPAFTQGGAGFTGTAVSSVWPAVADTNTNL